MHETRQRIIEFLKEKRQATVEELATAIDLTPMAVRYHLNVLQADNLISTFAVRRQSGPGRPQQIYKLTEAADELFPEDYRSLTDYLLDAVSQRLGKDGVGELFNNIANRLANEAPPRRENQTFEERLDEVVTFLTVKGFAVCWETDGNGYVIHAHSCPYRRVAKDHSEICLLDKHVISTMLNTTPSRIACLTNGDDHCTYRVAEPIELIMDPA
jgi:predicted ArsR family transcriptional regulator